MLVHTLHNIFKDLKERKSLVAPYLQIGINSVLDALGEKKEEKWVQKGR